MRLKRVDPQGLFRASLFPPGSSSGSAVFLRGYMGMTYFRHFYLGSQFVTPLSYQVIISSPIERDIQNGKMTEKKKKI